MLRRVLQEIKGSTEPIDLNQLARNLKLERTVLDSMIEFWVRKGKLQDLQLEVAEAMACYSPSCGGSCSPTQCPHVGSMPRSFTIQLQE
ncbi:FeoC-like transcriptional regulator [Anaerolineales bacterium HSG25]|nr:FeoC-like transcriptional regulator [Anaerolineales bacterium HSG25]